MRGGWISLSVLGALACQARPPLDVTETARVTPSYGPLTANGACNAVPFATFQEAPIPRQSGAFTWDFNVNAERKSDTVIGLAGVPVSDYTQLAAAVRFNTEGSIDVRNGAGYAADVSLPASAYGEYHVRMAVDVPSHTYSVWVTPAGAATVRLAAGYQFRSEQAAVTALDRFAGTRAGRQDLEVEICGSVVGPGEPPVSCVHSVAAGGFRTTPLPRQMGAFTFDVDATTSATPTDAVVGLVNGTATGYPSLAAAVRFNPAGFIDVRNGGGYASTSSYPYDRQATYHFTMMVNLATHRYDVWVTARGASAQMIQIAAGYAFRTEQTAVTALDGFAQTVDPDGAGTLDVCGATVDAATPTCGTAAASGTWVNRTLALVTGHQYVELDATPSTAPTDAVVGLSNHAASAYDNLAANVRFSPAGLVDARNGGGYAHESTLGYAAGVTHHVLFDVDVAAHVYSAWVAPGNGAPVRIANRYPFRPSQTAVSALDTVASFVDPDGSGALTACAAAAERPGQLLWVEGVEAGDVKVAPDHTLWAQIPSGQAFLDPANGQYLGYTGTPGKVALSRDAIYSAVVFQGGVDLGGGPVASDGPTDVYLAKYDYQGQRQWYRILTLDGEQQVNLIAACDDQVAISGPGLGTMVFDADGVQRSAQSELPAGLAFDHQGALLMTGQLDGDPTNVYVSKQVRSPLPVWRMTYAGTGQQDGQRVVADASDNVVFGGNFNGTINFGGTDLRWTPSGADPDIPPVQGFLVKLTPDARHVFSRVVDGREVRGLGADGLGDVAVSTLSNSEPHLVNFGKFDASGAQLWWKNGDDSELAPNGRGHAFDVAMDGFGRVFVHLLSMPDVETSIPMIAAYAP